MPAGGGGDGSAGAAQPARASSSGARRGEVTDGGYPIARQAAACRRAIQLSVVAAMMTGMSTSASTLPAPGPEGCLELESLGSRLGALGLATSRVAGAPAQAPRSPSGRPQVVAGIVAELGALLGEVRRVEAAHVTRALAMPGFDFELAQAELGALRQALGRLAGEVRVALGPLLEPWEKDALGRTADLAVRAPLTTRSELEAIRAARARR